MLSDDGRLGRLTSSLTVGVVCMCCGGCGVCGDGGCTWSGGGSGAFNRLRDWLSLLSLLMGTKCPTCTGRLSTRALGGEIIHRIITKLASTTSSATSSETSQRAISWTPSKPPVPHPAHRPDAPDPSPAPPGRCGNSGQPAPPRCLRAVLGACARHGHARCV